jgi:ribosomal protein S18 acetylase RimI-like enzyme
MRVFILIFKEFDPNEDDCHNVAKLVYSIDQKTYLDVFRSEDNAISAIEKLLLAGKDNFTPNGIIFNKGSEEFNGNIETNGDNQEFYIILNENKTSCNNHSSDNNSNNPYNNSYNISYKNSDNISDNSHNDADEIIGIVQMVKGGINGLFGNILNVFRHLKISDAFKFSFIYFLDYLVLAKTNSDDLYIAELAIDEKERGKGLGTTVLKEIIKKAKEKNFKRVVLDADFNNEAAFKLYKSLGFEVFNKRKVKLLNKEKGMNNMEYIL